MPHRPPPDLLTSRALTQQMPKLSIPEQIDLFEVTIVDLEKMHESCAIALTSLERTLEMGTAVIHELRSAMASAKQTVVDLRYAIGNLKNVGG